MVPIYRDFWNEKWFLPPSKHIFKVEVLHDIAAVAMTFVVSILPELRHVWRDHTLRYQRHGKTNIVTSRELLMNYALRSWVDCISCKSRQTRLREPQGRDG